MCVLISIIAPKFSNIKLHPLLSVDGKGGSLDNGVLVMYRVKVAILPGGWLWYNTEFEFEFVPEIAAIRATEGLLH